ncbi:MAG: hypothetical protein FJZ16_07800 [Candidatus Omnitrophica bacterium]|nr:hypothetical protein [Candidatus Omnitrophota bacterium]
MKYEHKNLAGGRWRQLSFIEQMANIGSEVERSLSWRSRNNTDYSLKAFERTLELIGLTVDGIRNYAKLKELTRLRELLIDFFLGENQYNSTESFWHNYFLHFAYAARKDY